ncbi:hypothetical protein EVAR_75029_1 [Eumeta japonica]|uniref:Uncharacterized protein n=1 Tax=Eumeta variegata TaxID=151549 RepID=A0A4C1W1Z2_EUMVA|nr:hypothetical protein EVAR_75029_1 [Eumeta japonica]
MATKTKSERTTQLPARQRNIRIVSRALLQSYLYLAVHRWPCTQWAPHGAYSFHAPAFHVPPKNAGPSIPVQRENIVIHKQNGYLKDSYGNHFVESPQSVAYKTMFPQQFVPLQELPSHLAQPLLAASPGLHFKETVPHFSYGSPVRVSQYYQAPAHFSAPAFSFKGPDHSHPAAYAEKTLRVSAPAQERYVQAVPSAAQEPSNHQVVYSNNYKPHKPQPVGFQRLEELPKAPAAQHGNDQRNQKLQNHKSSSQKLNLPPNQKSVEKVTVINDGKKTVVSFTTRPPLPLLNLDLLQPLVFENPVVPQVQHYLPRINYITYDQPPQSNKQAEPKQQNEVHVQSFYSEIVNKPQPEPASGNEEYQEREREEYNRNAAPPASEQVSAEIDGPNEEFIPLILDENFHDERARQNSYERAPIPQQYDNREEPRSPPREHHRVHSSPHDHQNSRQLNPEQYKSNSSPDDQPQSRPSPHSKYNSPSPSEDERYSQPHQEPHTRPRAQYHSEPQSNEQHNLRPSPKDHSPVQPLQHDSHQPKSLSQEQPQSRPSKTTNEHPVEHHHFYVEKHNPKPFSYSIKHYEPHGEQRKENVPHQPELHVEKQPIIIKQEKEAPPKVNNINAKSQQETDEGWIPKFEPIQVRPLEILQELWHEPQKVSQKPQFEEEYIKQQFEKQQQAFEPQPRNPAPRDAPIMHVKEKTKQIIIQEEEPEEMHEHREKLIAEMMEQEENNEQDFEKAYKEAAFGFPAYGRSSEEEKDIYNPNSYGVAREQAEYDFENTPFQRYVQEGDHFPRSARLGYKDERDHDKEEYYLDFSVKKPESMLDRFKKKENYYKLYKKSNPDNYFTSVNKKPKNEPKKSEKYVVDFDYKPAEDREPKTAFSAPYKVKPKFAYSYEKSKPKHSGFSHDSRPSQSFNKWRTTQFVEPQFQYGFEPLPPVLDGELSAMASSDSPEREKPGTRKKIYKENWYIHKTSTSAGNADS